MKRNVCLNCDKREIGCHSNCEDYRKYKANIERFKQAKEKEMKKYSKIRRK